MTKTKFGAAALGAVIFGAAACATEPMRHIRVGDPSVDVNRAQPYQATWRQLSPDENGEWVESGCFTEIFSRSRADTWVHEQTMSRGPVVGARQIRYLDAATLAPRSLRHDSTLAREGAPLSMEVTHRADGADVSIYLAEGEPQYSSRSYTEPVFDGWVAGLAIAALPLEEGFEASIPVAIPLQDQFYYLELIVVGSVEIEGPDGTMHPAWEVNSTWDNLDLGEEATYAGGRDQPGGAYYIAKERPENGPWVLEYANDTGDIVWGDCA